MDFTGFRSPNLILFFYGLWVSSDSHRFFLIFSIKASDSLAAKGYQLEGRKTDPRKGASEMKHKLKISVSKEPPNGGIVTCRNISIRERLLRFLMGNKRRVTVLIPGDNVGEIEICASEKGEGNEQNEIIAGCSK